MTTDQSVPDLTTVRRADRAVSDDAWIREYLHRAPYGVLGSVMNGQPFLNPITFVFDEQAHAIYLHSAREGRMRTNIEASDRVCFCVSEMGRLLPAKSAMGFSVEYASVIVFGRAAVVTDQAEARAALQRLLDKYFPHLRPERDYRPVAPPELAVTSVYRIRIEQWSAKRKAEPDDFPGAFDYGHPPA